MKTTCIEYFLSLFFFFLPSNSYSYLYITTDCGYQPACDQYATTLTMQVKVPLHRHSYRTNHFLHCHRCYLAWIYPTTSSLTSSPVLGIEVSVKKILEDWSRQQPADSNYTTWKRKANKVTPQWSFPNRPPKSSPLNKDCKISEAFSEWNQNDKFADRSSLTVSVSQVISINLLAKIIEGKGRK